MEILPWIQVSKLHLEFDVKIKSKRHMTGAGGFWDKQLYPWNKHHAFQGHWCLFTEENNEGAHLDVIEKQ